MTTIAVSTVPPASVPAGSVLIYASKRETTDKNGKKKEIPADQKYRAFLMPELTPSVSGKYLVFVRDALYAVAKQQFESQWKDQPMLREVKAADYVEDSLLAFAAREAESKKMTSDAIVAWYNASLLKQWVSENYNEAQQTKFLEELCNIAAPVPKYNEEKATKRIATLGKFAEDTEHEVCAAMILKLQRIVDAFKLAAAEEAKAAALDI